MSSTYSYTDSLPEELTQNLIRLYTRDLILAKLIDSQLV